MALGVLSLLFKGIGVISVLGVTFLYLTKNQNVKKRLFYFLAAWSMLVAAISATSFPSNYIIKQIVAWGIGFLSVIGIVIYIKSNTPKAYQVAQGLVTASVIIGVANLFFF